MLYQLELSELQLVQEVILCPTFKEESIFPLGYKSFQFISKLQELFYRPQKNTSYQIRWCSNLWALFISLIDFQCYPVHNLCQIKVYWRGIFTLCFACLSHSALKHKLLYVSPFFFFSPYTGLKVDNVKLCKSPEIV